MHVTNAVSLDAAFQHPDKAEAWVVRCCAGNTAAIGYRNGSLYLWDYGLQKQVLM